MKDGDGLGLAVAAVLGAGCCLALPLLVALAAGAALYLVAGLLVGVAALAVVIVVVARARRRRRTALAVAGSVAIVAALVAAASVLTRTNSRHAPGEGEATPTQRASADSGVAPDASGETATGFMLQTVDGGVFSLVDQRGKVVVVEFLAPGCPECAVDVAGLGKTAVEKKGDVAVLIADVSGVDDPRQLRDYYRGQLGAPDALVIAPDRQFTVAQSFGIVSLGETVVIGPDGRVSWKGRWSGDHGRLLDEIARASPS